MPHINPLVTLNLNFCNVNNYVIIVNIIYYYKSGVLAWKNAGSSFAALIVPWYNLFVTKSNLPA